MLSKSSVSASTKAASSAAGSRTSRAAPVEAVATISDREVDISDRSLAAGGGRHATALAVRSPDQSASELRELREQLEARMATLEGLEGRGGEGVAEAFALFD